MNVSHANTAVSTRPRRRSPIWALGSSVVIVAAVACSSGPTAADIAGEACALARRVAQGEVGILAVAVEANSIRQKASEADIRFTEVLDQAQRSCPDVFGLLGL